MQAIIAKLDQSHVVKQDFVKHIVQTEYPDIHMFHVLYGIGLGEQFSQCLVFAMGEILQTEPNDILVDTL